MRILSTLSSSFLFSSLALATGFDCKHINVGGYKYDLEPLKGVHTLYHVEEKEGYVVNTTYVLNICNILRGSAIRGDLNCGTSRNICGFRYEHSTDGSLTNSQAFPIAGPEHLSPGTQNPEITRLKELDSEREGLLMKLAGGQYRDKDKKKDARAVIEFSCDPDRSGLEGLVSTEDGSSTERRLRRENEDKDKDKDKDGDKGKDKDKDKDANDGADPSHSLQFKSFGPVDDDSYVLKLDWRTRHACDNYLRDKESDSNGWGFFTWLIIILFLCVAAYLIFGSWLNYNRYGARGWDLLPHGDTLRDIPYIFQDWLRRVINTLQGSGSRGGYSAV